MQTAGEDEQGWASVLVRCVEWSLCLCGSCQRDCLFSVLLRGASHVSMCLCAFWEYVPSCLATGWTWRLTSVAALHPWGQKWPWGYPHGGQSWIWLPLTVHSCNPQPATEQFHAWGSCTGQAHTAGCCFSWFVLLPLYLTASGSSLSGDSQSWHLPPLWVPLVKVHASNTLRKLLKCGGITTKQSPLRVTTCFLQQTAITVVAVVQMDTASSSKHLPSEN